MNATATAVQHVMARLRADATLMGLVGRRVHEGVVPEDPAPVYPLLLVQSYTDPDTITYNGGRIAYSSHTVMVRVVGPANELGPLVPIAERVTGTLHASRGTYTTGTVASCQQVAETSIAEVRNGRTWRYIGSRFRLMVS